MIPKTVEFIQVNKKLLLLACVVLFSLLVSGLRHYKENFNPKGLLPKSSPLVKDIDQLKLDFGNDQSFTLVVHSSDGIFDPASLKILEELTERLWTVPNIVRVETLVNYNYVSAVGDEISITPFLTFEQELTEEELKRELEEKKKLALNHHMLSKFMISEDGQSTMLLAHLAPPSMVEDSYDGAYKSMEKLVDEYQGRGGHQVYMGGRGAIEPAFRKIVHEDQAFSMSVIFLFLLIYLLIIFRSVVATILPIVVTACTVLMAMGVCFYLGYEFNMVLAVFPIILIAIAIADSVHIITSYYQFRKLGMDYIQATTESLKKNFLPTLITTVSTMIGFFSLMLSDFQAIAHLGLLGGIGCFFAWILSIFMMGPILFLFNLNTPKHFKNKKTSHEEVRQDHLWAKVTSWIFRYRATIIVVGVGFAIFSGFSASKMEIDSNPYKNFVEDFPIRVTQKFVREKFGSDSGPEIVIRSGREDGVKNLAFLKKVEQFKNWLHQQPYVFKTIDVIDIIKDMNQNFHGGEKKFFRLPENQKTVSELLFLYTLSLPQGAELTNKVTINYQSIRMSVFWNIFDTKEWLTYSDLLMKKAKEFGLDISLTGEINLVHKMTDHFISTFVNSLAVALLLIALMMTLIFRSLKIGALAMFINVLPLLLGGGLYIGRVLTLILE